MIYCVNFRISRFYVKYSGQCSLKLIKLPQRKASLITTKDEDDNESHWFGEMSRC